MVRLLLLLPLLAATPDGGAPLKPMSTFDDDRGQSNCPPPGYWDSKSKACRPGCGIPIRWENGVRIGGCGGNRELEALEATEVKRPRPRKQLLPPIRDGG